MFQHADLFTLLSKFGSGMINCHVHDDSNMKSQQEESTDSLGSLSCNHENSVSALAETARDASFRRIFRILVL